MALWIDKKYLNIVSSRLERFVWKTPDLANHRCPICGDSKKNKWKSRGYHYVKKNSLYYSCKNCGASMSTGNFIKWLDPTLYTQYAFERFSNGDSNKSNYKKPKPEELGFAEPVFGHKQAESVLDMMMERCDKLDEDHIAVKYLKHRKLPESKWNKFYYLDDTQKLENMSEKQKGKYNSHEPRLFMPFYQRATGRLVGGTARALLINDEGLFYDTEDVKRYLSLRIHEDDPMIYNLDGVNDSRKIYVVEGPIDSLFLDNAVAAGNTNLAIVGNHLPKKQCVLIYDYQPRNRELCKIIERSIKRKFNVCLLPANFPGKDINEAIKEGGLTSDEVMSIIDNNTYYGLEAELYFTTWKKV